MCVTSFNHTTPPAGRTVLVERVGPVAVTILDVGGLATYNLAYADTTELGDLHDTPAEAREAAHEAVADLLDAWRGDLIDAQMQPLEMAIALQPGKVRS
jgi:hypothetical protein